MTSHLLGFLLIGAFAFSAQTVVVRGYYATQDTLFPAIFGTTAVLLSIPVYILGIKWLGVAGVPLGVSLSSILQVTVLYTLWNRRSGNRESRKVYKHVGKMILLSLFLGVVLEGFKRIILSGLDPWSFQGSVFTGLFLGMLFLMLLFLAGKMLRIEEIRDILGEPMRRMRDRRTK
jgi:putative peptidoglycan lipid II flippase